ncbi:pimeloyl-ACP methyl ester carboxylesterase [Arthrobacter sp. V4I6]|uniref:alpha/beta fold hydrolase n=1 Tax=unclassified Arthrobacter TaxID=235627 RepID=UPI00277D66D0|nr:MULTISPECIES: alpha/beta fold hydrolase [unclassified Arthrobacter]MDQ0820869.1 pimeloyl-ACP methyl ester carboxylesterase [Arthrobacter sp. V1I7]MDQ0855130.1 pimeloyl-ACP methyl ester carboxylesterase [Arthrobacter sp. V4I6]
METLNERRRTVASKGAELAVFEFGAEPGPEVPTLLLVHGYPDDHRLYLPAIRDLARTHHVVAYDTRNAGASAVVELPGDFTLTTLVDDMFAVLAAVDAADVHLVGHDWGSIQGWAAVQDARAAGMIARYTSISGPDLRHFGRWVRSRFSRPPAWPQLAGQLLRRWYIGAFLLPKLPEAAWRLFLTRRYEQTAKRDVGNDPVRGLALYRANFFSAGNWPSGGRVTIPVQVVVPMKDSFLTPNLVEGLESWVQDLTVIRVDSGHWWPASRPAEFAELLRGGYIGR